MYTCYMYISFYMHILITSWSNQVSVGRSNLGTEREREIPRKRDRERVRCYRWIGSQLGTYFMRLRITSKRWYRSYKLPGGQPRNPRWEPSSFLAVPPSLGNHFFFLFFTILSSPLGPPFASASCCSVFLSLFLPRNRVFPLRFLYRSSRISPSPRVFASVHQRSIHQNYNNNNDKSRNNVPCPREYR